MRLLIHSNGPNVYTGYGIQTALLAPRLRAAGHDVAISTYYGHQTGLGQWEGFPLLPCSGESYGNDLMPEHAFRWFDNDPLGGWIIPIMDVFGLQTPALKDFNVAAWTPVDHNPVPPSCREFFTRTSAVPIAMSKWGQEQLALTGLDPMYAPLAIDTTVFKPTHENKGDAKTACGLSDDRFVVMMNGMNKGWAWDRKGFGEAFNAFGEFARERPDALLYVHAEALGPFAGGINLIERAIGAGIPEHQIKFVDQYAYMCGFIPPQQLAAVYSAADVLLAPSRGEGFCVPLIEAQACGTPVIVTDFSAQPELVGAGWKVKGQAVWEAPQTAYGVTPHIPAIIDALEKSYVERESLENRDAAITFAQDYDADRVFEREWLPILAKLEGDNRLELDRPPIPKIDGVAVLVPVLSRPQNVKPLVDAFTRTAGKQALMYFICDEGDKAEIDAVLEAATDRVTCLVYRSDEPGTFAQKINYGFKRTREPWVFICGDDVKFHVGWIDWARDLSDRFDVIGTNDHPDGEGNPKVASGSHADHFFIRRAYVDKYGGCLDGPGVVCHEYAHFYSDVETIELAKARRVFTPCLSSLVEHLHPDLGKGEVDETYQKGWAARETDEREWRKRAPLVQMQREGLSKVRAA